jgi:hypothetical protein
VGILEDEPAHQELRVRPKEVDEDAATEPVEVAAGATFEDQLFGVSQTR